MPSSTRKPRGRNNRDRLPRFPSGFWRCKECFANTGFKRGFNSDGSCGSCDSAPPSLLELFSSAGFDLRNKRKFSLVAGRQSPVLLSFTTVRPGLPRVPFYAPWFFSTTEARTSSSSPLAQLHYEQKNIAHYFRATREIDSRKARKHPKTRKTPPPKTQNHPLQKRKHPPTTRKHTHKTKKTPGIIFRAKLIRRA